MEAIGFQACSANLAKPVARGRTPWSPEGLLQAATPARQFVPAHRRRQLVFCPERMAGSAPHGSAGSRRSSISHREKKRAPGMASPFSMMRSPLRAANPTIIPQRRPEIFPVWVDDHFCSASGIGKRLPPPSSRAILENSIQGLFCKSCGIGAPRAVCLCHCRTPCRVFAVRFTAGPQHSTGWRNALQLTRRDACTDRAKLSWMRPALPLELHVATQDGIAAAQNQPKQRSSIASPRQAFNQSVGTVAREGWLNFQHGAMAQQGRMVIAGVIAVGQSSF